jgi:hypothetical protein
MESFISPPEGNNGHARSIPQEPAASANGPGPTEAQPDNATAAGQTLRCALDALVLDLEAGHIGRAEQRLETIERTGAALVDAGHIDAPLAQAYATVARQSVRDARAVSSVAAAKDIRNSMSDDAGPPPFDMGWGNPAWTDESEASEELDAVESLLAARGNPQGSSYSARAFLLDIARVGHAERIGFMAYGMVPDDVESGIYSAADLMDRTQSLAEYIKYIAADVQAFERCAEEGLGPLSRLQDILATSTNQGVLTPPDIEALYRGVRPNAMRLLGEAVLRNVQDAAERELDSVSNTARPRLTPTAQYLGDPDVQMQLGLQIDPSAMDTLRLYAQALDERAGVEARALVHQTTGTLTPALVERMSHWLEQQIDSIEVLQAVTRGRYDPAAVERVIGMFQQSIDRLRGLLEEP